MKFCSKCGTQISDDMVLCQKCESESHTNDENLKQDVNTPDLNENIRQKRIFMTVLSIVLLVFASIFAILSLTDVSLLAGVLLFGILGGMFLILAKTPKDCAKVFVTDKAKGFSKTGFVCICVFVSIFSFFAVINTSTSTVTTSGNVNTPQQTNKPNNEAQKPKIPSEFSEECPVTVSVSMYDNIIGLPEIKCIFNNKIDKEISAIQLYFVPRDVYGEEVDGIFAQNKLQTDDTIAANGSGTFINQFLDGTIKSGELYVYSVYFADGTEWGDRNTTTNKIKEYGFKVDVKY